VWSTCNIAKDLLRSSFNSVLTFSITITETTWNWISLKTTLDVLKTKKPTHSRLNCYVSDWSCSLSAMHLLLPISIQFREKEHYLQCFLSRQQRKEKNVNELVQLLPVR